MAARAVSSIALWGALLGTGFTYQGRLVDAGRPASGLYEMRFTLYDAANHGAAVGSPITNSNVSVTNGLFTATLDFGSSVFNDTAYWLETAVRTNGSASAFSVISPRQPVSAMPNALYAAKAGAADSASAKFYYSSSVTGVGEQNVLLRYYTGNVRG